MGFPDRFPDGDFCMSLKIKGFHGFFRAKFSVDFPVDFPVSGLGWTPMWHFRLRLPVVSAGDVIGIEFRAQTSRNDCGVVG